MIISNHFANKYYGNANDDILVGFFFKFLIQQHALLHTFQTIKSTIGYIHFPFLPFAKALVFITGRCPSGLTMKYASFVLHKAAFFYLPNLKWLAA